MATSTHLRRRYRLLTIAAVAVVLAAGGLAYTTHTAQGQASATLGELRIADVNETAQGNVSDLRVSTSVAYEYDVPDATRYIVKLKAGPSESELTTIDYVQTSTEQGSGSGTVDLDASLLSADGLSARDFEPPLAESASTEAVVAAEVEVRRANGEPVTHTVTDTVTVTIHDDASLTASVGGSGSIDVQYTG